MSQEALSLESQAQKKGDDYVFEPIKGYPMLNWRGKRPFTSTQFYPAQHKESHGPEVNGWRNKIYWGDNLQVMSHLLKEYRGKVDLVYIDPPFDSKADYKKKITVKGSAAASDSNSFEEKQYTDIWLNDEYLQFMHDRIVLIRELLSESGTIWIHCDWRKASYLRLILEEVFGPKGFRGHVIWRSMTSSGFKGKTSLGKSHDDILYFSKSDLEFVYNPVIMPYSEQYIEERFSKVDENGRRFKDEKIGTATPAETVEKYKSENRIYYTATGGMRIKHYLDEATGYPADDVWTDIFGENSQSKDLTGYPTQKPTQLLERIIQMTSNPGSLVFDCFMGSGTTQAVAMKLGRRFIGADINLGSIQTTTKRLLGVAQEIETNHPTLEFEVEGEAKSVDTFYTGFEVYNVNHYDVFRNPVQAKELLMDALEIQKLDFATIFDGEKDGKMVKIMPVNRIATKADLGELIAGFDYKGWERRQQEKPNQPVEKIQIVCMGHEPDLAAHLKKEAEPFLIDAEVVDVLRDKSRLEFKRDSEARVVTKSGNLTIESFYPMNLLQKLSLQKEDVTDWRELVESVYVDWNYDGAVLQPAITDNPSGKNDLVAGTYVIPADAGTICVKITDLLSESWEGTVHAA
ncbi:MAG: site-specific DNA-methyltransferase [Fibrobacterota bacterium]|nr:MAG: site-specific DNA-methyltransferase [Fibrobacterota bacterium]